MDQVTKLIERGVVNVIPDKNKLRELLESGKKLSVYLGIDPTAPRIHIGHTVPLRKMQTFIDLGHNVTFLIGDFTTLIGDTSDKNSERPILTKEEIAQNLKTYTNQAKKIIDFSKVSVKYNSEWLGKLNFEEIVKLTQHFGLGDFIGRELIKERLNNGKRVRLDETLYPVMQGYDSYFMDTDVQIGSADQTFNMQAGRTLQKDLRGKETYVLVTDYLMGTDGRKMSKSWGNAIWIEDPPEEMYGKIMSIKDDLIEQYLTLVTNVGSDDIKAKLETAKENPMKVKKDLAFTIVKDIYGDQKAHEAAGTFENTFQKGEPIFEPFELKSAKLSEAIYTFLPNPSLSEAKRLINQGGVEVDGQVITDPGFVLHKNAKIKIGKKIFKEAK